MLYHLQTSYLVVRYNPQSTFWDCLWYNLINAHSLMSVLKTLTEVTGQGQIFQKKDKKLNNWPYLNWMLFHPQTLSHLLSQLFVTHFGVALLVFFSLLIVCVFFWLCVSVEALHLAHLMASHGYFFPIDDHMLTVKNDNTYYRFQVYHVISLSLSLSLSLPLSFSLFLSLPLSPLSLSLSLLSLLSLSSLSNQ